MFLLPYTSSAGQHSLYLDGDVFVADGAHTFLIPAQLFVTEASHGSVRQGNLDFNKRARGLPYITIPHSIASDDCIFLHPYILKTDPLV